MLCRAPSLLRSYNAFTPLLRSLHVPSRVPPEHLRHPVFSQLEQNLAQLPCFPTRGKEHVRVLYEPKEFYQTLLQRIKRAKRRIFFASLYVGKEEQELVAVLHSSLSRNPSLHLTFLVDYLRSTRESPKPSSASLLATLAAAFPKQVDLRLYHTPELNGWARRLVPKRFNEGWGLQHMKIYGVDDDVIISGANLSHDYFTNRTDRYLHFISHAPLASYFSSLISLISRYSFRVTASDTTTSNPAMTISWPEENAIPEDPFEKRGGTAEMKLRGREELEVLTRRWQRMKPQELASSLPAFAASLPQATSSSSPSTSPPPSPSASSSVSPLPPAPKSASSLPSSRRPSFLSHFDTSLRPVLQLGPFSISHETSLVVPEIFRTANKLATAPGGKETTLDWTSGYFSLREGYRRLVLDSKARVRIVSAAPEANGFYNSRGVSRFIPPAYTYFAQRFYEETQAQAAKKAKGKGRGEDGKGESHVEMKEWKREGWTYHAKGIWLAPSLSNPYSPPAADPHTAFSPSDAPDPHDLDLPLRHSVASPPFLSLVGSSNYGSRSAALDLEAMVLLTTQSSELRWALEHEVRAIREHARTEVDGRLFEREERRVPWGVRKAARVIEGML